MTNNQVDRLSRSLTRLAAAGLTAVRAPALAATALAASALAGTALAGTAPASATPAAAPRAAMAVRVPDKVPPSGGTSCMLGTWELNLEVFTVASRPFASGGQGAIFTVGKAPGFKRAAGPMTISVDFTGSGYLTFFDGFIRTQTTGTLFGWVKLANGHLAPAGHLSQQTSMIEQMHLGGKWVTVKPNAQPASASKVPVPTFQGWGYYCHSNHMVLTLDMSAESAGSGLSWTLFRK
jgi:hypothetical protein